jgi:SAM-dependent methyltransferase
VTSTDPDENARRLAGESLAADDPTGWFEQLYAAAETGQAAVPWDRGAPGPMLVRWAEQTKVRGSGRPALVVGCGFGDDAEYIATLGFDTVAFDVSASAIRAARRRFPDSPVRYVVANVLEPPVEWRHAFDLVVESQTVQALPVSYRKAAITGVSQMVRAGGTIVVLAVAEIPEPHEGPPWPLTRADIDAFADSGLEPVRVENVADGKPPAIRRWSAEFRRPG